MPAPILEVRDIVKTFPGVRALDGVHFELAQGEVHGLVGENGAGKTTLMHVLGGVHMPDFGTVHLDGKLLHCVTPHQATRCGISIVYQELSLVPSLSIAENIYAHRQPVNAAGLIKGRRLYSETQNLLQLFDLDIDPRMLVKHLSPARQQVVEILKAISHRPKVLILDEPTSSLTAIEVGLLFRNIRCMREQGMAFIYISHHLPEIFEICNRVTVLRDGRNVTTFEMQGLTEAQLVKSMVGRDLLHLYGSRSSQIGDEYFRVEKASRKNAYKNVSLSLRKGEILGLAGLVGAGRTEIARGICGSEPFESGKVILNGNAIRIRRPADSISHGIAYMTEDRKDLGLFLRMPVRDNCIAVSLRSFADKLGMLCERKITEFAEESRRKFRITTPHVGQQVRNLSGGNQQKVLLSMWMGINPLVLIVDEPTRGVDVGAKSEIYGLLRDLTTKGVGIIMVSSDLLEILGLSDRIVVMRKGELAGEFQCSEATEERIIACATGVDWEQGDTITKGASDA